jgi:hypothetical protein
LLAWISIRACLLVRISERESRSTSLPGRRRRFDHLGDSERREYLEKIPTNFSLSDKQVDRVIEAGRTLLRESPSFKEAIETLR